jgi:hypothetical protein
VENTEKQFDHPCATIFEFVSQDLAGIIILFKKNLSKKKLSNWTIQVPVLNKTKRVKKNYARITLSHLTEPFRIFGI